MSEAYVKQYDGTSTAAVRRGLEMAERRWGKMSESSPNPSQKKMYLNMAVVAATMRGILEERGTLEMQVDELHRICLANGLEVKSDTFVDYLHGVQSAGGIKFL